MATTVPIPEWKLFARIANETAWNTNAATVDWNIGGNGGGASGWRDLPVARDTILMTPNPNVTFPEYQAGKRAINQQAPIEGAFTTEGEVPMLFFPELVDPLFEAYMGDVTRTPTAGAAALASTAFASVSTLDTQPNGTEQLKFVISSSTASSSAVINIVQNAVTVETITIGTSASSVDGDYYSKGAYDGSSNAVSFTVSGTVTSGNVVISGIDLNTNVFTLTNNPPSTFKLEEGGLARSGSSSNFYNGVAIPSMTLEFDRTAADGMITVTAPLVSRFPATATAGTWASDAKNYYHPFAGWTASITKDGSSFDKLQGATITINPNNALFAVSSGNQQPSGAVSKGAMVTLSLNILPEDSTEWDAFVAQTVADYHIVFTSPNNIVDSTKWTTTFEFSEAYIGNYESGIVDDLVGADLSMTMTDDASDGIIKVTNVCRMPV